MNKKKNFIFIVLAFVTGCLVAFFVASKIYNNKMYKVLSSIVPMRENNFNYKFTFPLLYYNLKEVLPFLEDHTLSDKLNDYVNTQYKNSQADSISVYYRDLSYNHWAEVNQDVMYHPASMMKVAVMIAYYRDEQLDPSIMQRYLVYTNDINQRLKSLGQATASELDVGTGYKVADLIKKSIEKSDNGADLLLLQNVNKKVLDDTLQDLNLNTPEKDPNYTISAKGYAILLRVLYNATYLSEANSEEALSIMSKTTYKDGIEAGVPDNILVAQKYGENVEADPADPNKEMLELSNCGIFYTKEPYELCVMTKRKITGAEDDKKLASILKDVSGLVYNYVTP